MGLCGSRPQPPDPFEVHARLEAWCASIRLQFNRMPVLIVCDAHGDITVDGNLPQDIRDQFGFVKHAEATRININTVRRKPLWVIEGNRQKSDEPLITAAYVMSALMDAHGYKIVGQSAIERQHRPDTTYAMAKEK